MGIEQPSRLATVLARRARCSRPGHPARKRWPSEDEVGAVAPVGGKGVAILVVDQLGQGRRRRFVADVPGLQPGQLGVGQAGLDSALDPGEAEVDRITQDCDSSNVLSFGLGPVLQVGEVAAQARPVVHVHQQFGDSTRRQNWLVWSISACARSVLPHPAG